MDGGFAIARGGAADRRDDDGLVVGQHEEATRFRITGLESRMPKEPKSRSVTEANMQLTPSITMTTSTQYPGRRRCRYRERVVFCRALLFLLRQDMYAEMTLSDQKL